MSFRQLSGSRMCSRDLWFLASVFLLGSSVLIPLGATAGGDAWAAVIANTIGGMVVTWVCTQLSSRFPGKASVEISHSVFGSIRPLGAVSLVMLLFNFSSVSENIRFTALTYQICGLTFQLFLLGSTLAIESLKARLARPSERRRPSNVTAKR